MRPLDCHFLTVFDCLRVSPNDSAIECRRLSHCLSSLWETVNSDSHGPIWGHPTTYCRGRQSEAAA